MFLFKIYQHYPEAFCKQAMVKIRTDQMVTVRKNLKKSGTYIPMSSSQYKLSANYEYKLQTKWPKDIFTNTLDVYIKLLRYYTEQWSVAHTKQRSIFNGIEIQPVSSGIVMIMHALLACNQIDFDIELPEQIIMLDSRSQDKDETYFRVAQKYEDILTRMYRFKLENPDTQNGRSDLDETETSENSAMRKRPADKSDELKEPAPKIRRKNECDEVRWTKDSPRNQQNKVVTEKKSKEPINRRIEHEELSSKDQSGVQVSAEKNHAERSPRKRSVTAEMEFVDCGQPILKRPRYSSDDSMELPDMDEESSLYEDLKNMEQMKITNKSLQMKELAEGQAKEAGMLFTCSLVQFRSWPIH